MAGQNSSSTLMLPVVLTRAYRSLVEFLVGGLAVQGIGLAEFAILEALPQPWTGNDMDTYADDLKALVEHLDLKDAIHVGHSPHGLCTTHKNQVNEELISFIKG